MPIIDFYGPDGWGAEDAVAELPRQRSARQAIVRVLAGRRSGPARVADVGCGDGTFIEWLARDLPRDTQFVGLDYAEHQLAKAARLPYEFHKCDLGDGIGLPDASLDVVHAAEVIEHLLDPDLLVEEAARVLKPGGHLIVTTPNLFAWYNRVLIPLGIQPVFYETSARSTQVGSGVLGRFKVDVRPVGHLRVMHIRAVHDLFRRSGLRPLRPRGSTYHDVPRPARWLDRLFSKWPAMSSVLVLVARKEV